TGPHLPAGSVAPGSRVSSGVFPLLGVSPTRGRLFADADYVASAPAVAIVTDRFWRNELTGDSTIVGQTLTIEGVVHTVAGVPPHTFAFQQKGLGVLLPLTMGSGAADRNLSVMARLAPGATVTQLDQEAQRLAAQIERPDADDDGGVPRARSLRESLYAWDA